ncbi:MAG: M14 family metallopeptidase [Firmicutes bacterium]|nr:M14 family metallopeptidase [Bacillota bacterium]
MNALELFSARGAYVMRDGKPLAAQVQFIVPDVPSASEIAAVLEVAGRFAIETLFVPNDPALTWCHTTQPEPPVRCSVIVGLDAAWVREKWGKRSDALPTTVATYLECESGTLAVARASDGQVGFLITGDGPAGLLGIARMLATSAATSGTAGTDASGTQGTTASGAETGVSELATARDGVEQSSADSSLHALRSVRGLFVHPMQDGEAVLATRLRVDGNGRSVLHSHLRWLTALCRESSGAIWPLTFVEGVDSPDDRLITRVNEWPDNDGALPCFRVDLSETELSVFLSTSPTAADHAALSELLTAYPTRSHVPWRQRLDHLIGPAEDLASRAWDEIRHSRDTSSETLGNRPTRSSIDPLSVALSSTPAEPSAPAAPASSTAAPDSVWRWTDPGETSDLHALVADLLGRQVETCAMVAARPLLEIFSTASTATCEYLRQTAHAAAHAIGMTVDVEVRSAHKSGLHWVVQDVLPGLRELQRLGDPMIDSVHLSARRLDPPESAPGQEPVSIIDRSIRYLQELYPADLLLAEALGLYEEGLSIELRESGPMFQVQACDTTGAVLLDRQFEGWTEWRPYLPCTGDPALVCVPVAGVRLTLGQDVVAQQAIATDADRMWTWYNREVLPALKADRLAAMSQTTQTTQTAKTAERATEAMDRPFERLEIHVWTDTEDRPLTEVDSSSVGEALAEDLYFNSLEIMRRFATETGDTSWTSPGAIIPYMHERGSKGGPSAEVRVYAASRKPPAENAPQSSSGSALDLPANRIRRHSLRVRSVEFCDGVWSLTLKGDGLAPPELRALEQWLVRPGDTTDTTDTSARTEGPTTSTATAAAVASTESPSWTTDALYPQHIDAILQKVPDAFVLEHSYGGVPIWLVQCCEMRPGWTTSALKQALWKPTLFINARHHANEVSSTNAALLLMREVQTRPAALERVNVILLPLQNVDGALTHASLCEEHPTWMHHAARYNACGEEFARDYFNPASPYGESRTYGHVWSRWRPDIFLDDHGIPSHEWVQPFAGWGSPPSFGVSYWIPQARMYTIWRRPQSDDAAGTGTSVAADAQATGTETGTGTGPRHRYQMQIERHVATSIRANQPVSAANGRLLRRYNRWGHAWDSAYFPLTLTDGMLTFAHEAVANPASRSPIARFPDDVTAEIVTETDDETVIGAHLSERVAAHQVVHHALLEWLTATPQPLFLRSSSSVSGEVTLRLDRPRPLHAEQ